MIQSLYDKFFHAIPSEKEWSVWHKKTESKIAKAKLEGVVFELTDPTEVKYYQWITDEISNIIGSIDGPILEVGGGSGALSFELSKRFGCKATILDSSDVALEYVKIVFGEHDHVLVKGDATDIQFSNESFSLVHSIGLIEHFSDDIIDKMVKEMSRLVSKKGNIFIAISNYFSPDMISLWMKYGKGSERYISVKRLAEIASNAGLSIVASGHSEFSFSEDLGRFIPRSIEKILGRCGLGFLNYVMCKK